jgi:hypothetical protein
VTSRRRLNGTATSRPLDQAGVLVVGHGGGLLGEHDRNAVLYPVTALQPRVIQQCLIGEVQQAALVNRADQDLKQRFVQGHESLLS